MKWILYALPILLLTSCGKIKTPNQEAKKIFGKWRFLSSSGGFGGGGNPSYDSNDTYEYKENGKFFHYKGSVLVVKEDFKIHLGISDLSQQSELMIKYGGLLTQLQRQSYTVQNDTLILSDECYDGFQYVFKRI
ncbi:MAG: hypothetical protein RLZZ65_1197 [Bacteroidota bacterium]|jgi:hypothetical protein